MALVQNKFAPFGILALLLIVGFVSYNGSNIILLLDSSYPHSIWGLIDKANAQTEDNGSIPKESKVKAKSSQFVLDVVRSTLCNKPVSEQLIFANRTTLESELKGKILIEFVHPLIANETFSSRTLKPGEMLNVSGTLNSGENESLNSCISLLIETDNPGESWEFVLKDPPANRFVIRPQEITPYLISVKALEPGVYRIFTLLNVENVGIEIAFGQTILVKNGVEG